MSSLRRLIRAALDFRGMSMRQASLAAGMNETWVKSILNSKKSMDPGIGAMVRLADVLGIDRLELLRAVEQDGDGASLEAAIEVISNMSPEERAAFVAAHGHRRSAPTD